MYLSIYYQIEKLFFPFTAVPAAVTRRGNMYKKKICWIRWWLTWLNSVALGCCSVSLDAAHYMLILCQEIFQSKSADDVNILCQSVLLYFFCWPFLNVSSAHPYMYFFDVNLSALVDTGKFYFLFSHSNSTHSIDFSENCTTWNSTSRTWEYVTRNYVRISRLIIYNFEYFERKRQHVRQVLKIKILDWRWF